jgi:hypothetical protein
VRNCDEEIEIQCSVLSRGISGAYSGLFKLEGVGKNLPWRKKKNVSDCLVFVFFIFFSLEFNKIVKEKGTEEGIMKLWYIYTVEYYCIIQP